MASLFIGLMSGTSADAIDAALVEFSESGTRILGKRSEPWPASLRQAILAVTHESPLHEVARLDAEIGELFATASLKLLAESDTSATAISAIGSHGQTLWHAPDATPPYTLQVGDPNRISERTGITTVADLRRRDLAAGGQGAPLAPAFHRAVFSAANEQRVILNLGGIANITVLDSTECRGGFDTGPANTLMDGWVRRHLQKPYDADGAWAASGQAHARLLDQLLKDPYFHAAPPKSTGPEHFSLDWLQRELVRLGEPLAPADTQATLLELTAASVTQAVQTHAPKAQRVIVCGGGAHNSHLIKRIAERLDCEVVSATAHGLDPDYVEAAAFAWLAKQTLAHAAGNLPCVTGASHEVVLGGIYPGRTI